jgi:schlafen family protein
MAYLPLSSVEEAKERLVAGVARENHWLEFKTDLGSDNIEIARDIAQFANASGGVLIIGAVETDQALIAFNPLPDPPKLIARLDNIVKGNLTPVPVIEPHIFKMTAEATIVAVNVPPSLTLVARHEKHERYEFVIRAGESKRYMTLLEVEARMQDHERRMRLRLERIPADAPVRMDALVHGTNIHGWRVRAVTDDAVTLWIDGVSTVVPLTYVLAVYSSGEPGAEWVIALSCELHARPVAHPNHIVVKRVSG